MDSSIFCICYPCRNTGKEIKFIALHSFISGADFAASALTLWIYINTTKMSRKLNIQLYYGILIVSYVLPSIFLGSHFNGARQKKKFKLIYFFVAQIFGLIGPIFYACSFSPFLVIVGRICQGLFNLSPMRTSKRNETSKSNVSNQVKSISFSIGIITTSIAFTFINNINVSLGNITINYGNFLPFYMFILIIITQLLTIILSQRKRFMKITNNNTYWCKYKTFSNRIRVKATLYQRQQEIDEERLKLKISRFKQELNCLEHLIDLTDKNKRYLLTNMCYSTHVHFSVTLTTYTFPIILFQSSNFDFYVSNIYFATYGITRVISVIAIWSNILPFPVTKSMNITLVFGLQFLVVGCIYGTLVFQSFKTKIALIFLSNIIGAYAVSGMSFHQVQSHTCVEETFIRKDTYTRIVSLLSDLFIACGAMVSPYLYRYPDSFSVILIVINILLICMFIKLT